MAVVSGTIISSNPSIHISADIQVQAFDQDMRSGQQWAGLSPKNVFSNETQHQAKHSEFQMIVNF